MRLIAAFIGFIGLIGFIGFICFIGFNCFIGFIGFIGSEEKKYKVSHEQKIRCHTDGQSDYVTS
jgi:hypothetical protein